MDNIPYDLLFLIVGSASSLFFIILERTGMLKQRWVLATLGILSIILYGVALWIFTRNWNLVFILLLGGVIGILYVVFVEVRRIVRGIRLHLPITFNKQQIRNSSSKVSKVKENKIMLVVNAITEAKQITPKNHDTFVFISDENSLTSIEPLELLSILLILQNDEKILKLKAFPRWLLSGYDYLRNGNIGDDPLKEIGIVIDEQENKFVISLEKNFDVWFNNFKSR